MIGDRHEIDGVWYEEELSDIFTCAYCDYLKSCNRHVYNRYM